MLRSYDYVECIKNPDFVNNVELAVEMFTTKDVMYSFLAGTLK